MKYKDPETGGFKDIHVKAADTLPVGTIVDYEGDETPAGWEEVYDEDKKSFAQMYTYGEISYTEEAPVTNWDTSTNVDEGDFVCEPENNRILIPKGSAEYIRVFGTMAGTRSVSASLVLEDEDSNSRRTIFCHQPQGNQYFIQSAWDRIYKLDITKDYYLRLNVSGYNGETFKLNAGFGSSASFIGVQKLK